MAFSFYRRPLATGRFIMSFFSWIRQQRATRVCNPARNGRRRVVSKRPPAYRPQLELLEVRLAPAIVQWDGGSAGTGTNWNTAANWVGDVLPVAADTAQIGAAF